MNVIIALAAEPEDGVYVTHADIEPPAGIVPAAALANCPSEDETDARFRSASPVFDTVKQNEAEEPTFRVPKSFDSGVTLMTGPLTVAARVADSDDSDAGEAIASPGTSASARRPRRATFRKARLRIACPPSCEQLNE
ncbi:MAG TPA: hypothetical protein VI198_07480 [Candidatus Eisenbacteria bacterium]